MTAEVAGAIHPPERVPTPPSSPSQPEGSYRNKKRANFLWKSHQGPTADILKGADGPISLAPKTGVVESLRGLLPAIPQLPKWRQSNDNSSAWRRSPRQQLSDPNEGERITRIGSTEVTKHPAAGHSHSDSDLLRTESSPERRPSMLSQASTARSGGAQSRKEAKLMELIPGQLYFALHANESVTRQQICEHPGLYFFSCNLHECYIPFASDFGPVNLGSVFRFWRHVRSKATNPALGGRPLVYYSDYRKGHIANAAFLLAAYMVLEHQMVADDVIACFSDLRPNQLVPFRDASAVDCGFRLSLRDCIDGLVKALNVGWFDPDTFKVDEYDRLEHPLGGDINAIGDKFFAFRGPGDTSVLHATGMSLSAPFYANTLRAKGVSAVVRLNERSSYQASHFVERGLRHYELNFPDCSNPSRQTVKAFLDICDAEEGVVGVHCKAGLGRTGTLIALWMMKNLGFTAREAIGWLRIVRPGSVIGQQQHFLLRCERAGFVGNTLEPMAEDDGPIIDEAASNEVVAQQVAAASNDRALAQLRLPRLKA